MSEEPKVYGYRWVILILAFLVHCGLQVALIITMGMGGLLMGPDVGLSVVEFSALATIPYITGFIFGIVGGAWADRTSIRTVMIFGLAVASIGGIIRALSMNFGVMLGGSFLLGLSLAALNANSAKLFRLWFPGRWTSIAMGIYILGATAGGGAIAMSVGPRLADPHTGFVIGAICVVVCLVLWIALGKTYPGGERDENAEPMTKYLGIVLKNKYVWIVSFVMFFVFGASIAENSYLVSGLVTVSGDPVEAANIGTVNMIAVGIGGVLMPTFLAKAKNLKVIFCITAVLMGLTNIVMFFLPIGPITYFLVIIQGAFMGLLLPIGKTLPAVIPGINPEHLGAAGGIQSSMQNLGAGLLPAYVVAPIATAVAGVDPVAVATALMVGTGLLVIFSGIFVMMLPKGTNAVDQVQE